MTYKAIPYEFDTYSFTCITKTETLKMPNYKFQENLQNSRSNVFCVSLVRFLKDKMYLNQILKNVFDYYSIKMLTFLKLFYSISLQLPSLIGKTYFASHLF